MIAWFRKGVGITSASNAVSAWADQTGLGSRDYAQATGASQPALQGDGTILFNGTSHGLKTPTFTVSQPYTRYIRVKQVSWTAGRYIFDGSTLNSGILDQRTATPNISMYAGIDTADTTALAVGVWGSVGVVFNSTTSSINVGGTVTTGNASTINAAGLSLGFGGGGAGQWSNIQVAEEIVYSVAHDTATQASILAYLNTL